MSAATDSWNEAFRSTARSDPDWLDAERRAAMQRFSARGFPTRREEAWKYTNPSRIGDAAYGALPELRDARDRVAAHPLSSGAATLAVFGNGRFLPELSRGLSCRGLEALPVGTRAGAAAPPEGFADIPRLPDHPFSDLAMAFFVDGLALRIKRDVVLDEPIVLLFLADGLGAVGAAHTRVSLFAERGSRAEVVEAYAGSAPSNALLVNALTQIELEDGASLSRCAVTTGDREATLLTNSMVRCGRDSRFTHTAISLGSKISREDLLTELAGSGASATLRGLYFTADGEHADHQTTVVHAVPHCQSDQLYRGVLGGASRGAFSGKVIVREDAQKSDAVQKNESLLLSDRAESDSKPQLEIYADDVKCSHGSTIGQLDENQIFYLRSRGIDEDAARALLVTAFARVIPKAVTSAALRETLETMIAAHLPTSGRTGDGR